MLWQCTQHLAVWRRTALRVWMRHLGVKSYPLPTGNTLIQAAEHRRPWNRAGVRCTSLQEERLSVCHTMDEGPEQEEALPIHPAKQLLLTRPGSP